MPFISPLLAKEVVVASLALIFPSPSIVALPTLDNSLVAVNVPLTVVVPLLTTSLADTSAY